MRRAARFTSVVDDYQNKRIIREDPSVKEEVLSLRGSKTVRAHVPIEARLRGRKDCMYHPRNHQRYSLGFFPYSQSLDTSLGTSLDTSLGI